MKRHDKSKKNDPTKDRMVWSVPSLNDLSSQSYIGANCDPNGSGASTNCYNGSGAGSTCGSGAGF